MSVCKKGDQNLNSAFCLTESPARLQAQYLVCQHLVRACRQGMYEIAIEEDGDPEVRQEAIRMLKIIHADWIQARRDLRREVTNKQRKAYTSAGRVSQ